VADRDQRHLADRHRRNRQFNGTDTPARIWDAIEGKLG
jgi:hypothetical protein